MLFLEAVNFISLVAMPAFAASAPMAETLPIGKPLHRPWITHDEITAGGKVEFGMDILPNKIWGTGN